MMWSATQLYFGHLRFSIYIYKVCKIPTALRVPCFVLIKFKPRGFKSEFTFLNRLYDILKAYTGLKSEFTFLNGLYDILKAYIVHSKNCKFWVSLLAGTNNLWTWYMVHRVHQENWLDTWHWKELRRWHLVYKFIQLIVILATLFAIYYASLKQANINSEWSCDAVRRCL